MKRSGIRSHARALPRRKPLRRYTALQAKGAPKQQRVKPAVPADVRALVGQRSGGWCEIGREGCWHRAMHVHHRQLQQNGGRSGEAKEEIDRLSNLLHSCGPCHSWVHGALNRREAEGYGWIVRQCDNPASMPVVRACAERRTSIVYLADIGGVYPYEDHGP
jgi:hypothetical protein